MNNNYGIIVTSFYVTSVQCNSFYKEVNNSQIFNLMSELHNHLHNKDLSSYLHSRSEQY